MTVMVGWSAVQHLYADVSSTILNEIMLEIIRSFIEVPTNTTVTTVEHMFSYVAATYDRVQKRWLQWLLTYTSSQIQRASGSMLTVRLPRDEAFEMQGGEHHLNADTDPLGFVCAMVGLTPGNDADSQSPELHTFIGECLRYLKAGSDKEGFRPVVDGAICAALMLLIGDEGEGPRRGVRSSLLRQGALPIMVDVAINNDCLGFVECMHAQKAFSHLFAELVACFYSKADSELEHGEVPHIHLLTLLQALQRVTAELHNTTQGRKTTVTTVGMVRVMYAVGNLILRPHTTLQTMPAGTFGVALEAYRACKMVVALSNSENNDSGDAAVNHGALVRELPHLKKCTLALTLGTMQIEDQLDDQISHLYAVVRGQLSWNGALPRDWHGPKDLFDVMETYGHVPQIPYVMCCILSRNIHAKSYQLDPWEVCQNMVKSGLIKMFEPVLSVFPHPLDKMDLCLPQFLYTVLNKVGMTRYHPK
jgi:hypothetical protein